VADLADVARAVTPEGGTAVRATSGAGRGRPRRGTRGASEGRAQTLQVDGIGRTRRTTGHGAGVGPWA
jgi:hypothetical protein